MKRMPLETMKHQRNLGNQTAVSTIHI